MQKEKKQRLIIALVMLLLITAFVFMCIKVETANAFRKADERAQRYFDSITEMVDTKSEITANLVHQQEITLYQLARCLSTYYGDDADAFRLALQHGKEQAPFLQKACDSYDAEMLIITDDQGRVVLSSREALIGENIAENGFFTPEQFQHLTERENGPVFAEDDFDSVVVIESEDEIEAYVPYTAPMQADDARYYVILLVDYGILSNRFDELIQDNIVLDTGSDEEFGIEILPLENVDEENIILYCKFGGVDYSMQPYSELGLSEDLLQDGYAGVETINGRKYYCRTGSCELYGGMATVLVVTATSFLLIWDSTPLIPAAALLLWFCLYMCVYKKRSRGMARVLPPEGKREHGYAVAYFSIALVGALLTFVLMFYMQTLSETSLSFYQTKPGQQQLFTEIENTYAQKESVYEATQDACESQANLLRMLIEGHPDRYFMDDDPDAYRAYLYTNSGGRSVSVMDECANPLQSISEGSGLRALCKDYEMQRLTLYNADGYAIADSGSEWYARIERDSEETGELFEVLDRKKDICFRQPEPSDEDDEAEEILQIAVPVDYYVRAEDGRTVFTSEVEYQNYQQTKAGARVLRRQGLLVCEKNLAEIMPSIDEEVLGFVISSNEIVQDCKFVLTDTSDEHLLYYGAGSDAGKSAADLGFSDAMFSDDSIGFLKYHGQKYFAVSRLFESENADDMFVISMLPVSKLYAHRMRVSLMVLAGAAILLGLMALMLTLYHRGDDPSIMIAESSADEKKRDRTLSWINLTVLVLAMAAFIYVNSDYMDLTMFNFIIFGSWERGVNLFSLSWCFFMVIALLLLSRVLKHAENTFSLLNARGETLARLVASAIRYGAGLFVIFYSLYLLGLDTSSVLRSLGAFSLIVGLGAQSLIKDIIAGIFVVFEGSYHVGDIVEINKFRGKVTEIALRTTKLENLDGNVMIFNNNAISNVENLSIHSSNVTCDLHLPKTLDPDEAKERILAELPEIRSRNPEIRGEIIYDGIIETNSTGYVVRLIVHCREHDRGRLWRRMNREMIELTRKLNLD